MLLDSESALLTKHVKFSWTWDGADSHNSFVMSSEREPQENKTQETVKAPPAASEKELKDPG